MSKFRKVFMPTEEDRQEHAINYLNAMRRLIKNKSCCTCKYSECRTAYMHSYETTETYCKKKECLAIETCDMYEIMQVKDMFK